MSDEIQIEGTLTGFEKGKSGMKADGVTAYTNYRYEITKTDGSKFKCGGFVPPAPFIEKYVIVTYVVKEEGEKTYHNVKNIVEGVPNATPAAPPQADAPAPQPAQQAAKPTPILTNDHSDLFEMVSNQVTTWMVKREEEADVKFDETNFEVTWNDLFEKLWKLNTTKKKEKGVD